jgi:glucan phosphoethanolaminetransferase (alkaline phosphatase superfamily)
MLRRRACAGNAALRTNGMIGPRPTGIAVALCVVWTLVALSPNIAALPMWPWVVAQHRVPVDVATQVVAGGHPTGILLSLALCALLFALLGRGSRYVLAVTPFAALAPLETLFILKYGQPTSATVIGVAAATHFAEAREFASGVVLAALGCALALLALGVALSGWLRRRDVVVRARTRALVAGAIVAVAALAIRHEGGLGTVAARPASGERAHDVLSPLERTVERTWPLGIAARFAEYGEHRRRIRDARAAASTFRFGAAATADDVTIVLVIGESIRADHLGLNGYARDTTPRLARIDGLVSYRHALALAGATRESVPFMLTRRSPRAEASARASERGIVAAFEEAGFDTWWISTQAPIGDLEDAITAFADEARRRRFLNPAGYAKRAALDEEAVVALRDALAERAPRRMLVVHLLQAHWDYRFRYPPAFDVFRPSGESGEVWSLYSTSRRAAIVNAYDNAVRYADHVLAELIESLGRERRPAALVYMSDHGQALFDGACLTAGHGIHSATVFSVPLLAWVSPEFARAYPDKAAALRAHRDRPVTAESIFPTLADLGGLRLPGDKRELSLASPGYAPGERAVTLDLVHWIDERSLAARDCAAAR